MPPQPARSDHLTIEINRAPVLTLWATVVAERLGFNHEEALTLGKAVSPLERLTFHVKEEPPTMPGVPISV